MIVLPTEVLDLIDAGTISVRGLIRFDFGTGTYGFIKASAPITYSGLEYKPGSLIEVSDLSSEAGLVAKQFTISLSASGDDLTPAVLQTIEAEDYRDRPVKVMDAYFHPNTGKLLFVQTLMRGYVDNIDHIDTQDSGYTIVANCESRGLDYTRMNGRKRNDLDQARRSTVDDHFFLFSSTRGREKIYWGQNPPSLATKKG